MKFDISTMLKGGAMGIAEVIPGVSGGTIAFISGIYERLLNAIKSFDIEFFNLLLKGKFATLIKKIDFWFLLSLFFGMAVGIIIGVFLIDYLIRNHPEPLWGFFFGLILASAIFVGRQVAHWSIPRFLQLTVGFALAFGITMISPAEGNPALWYVFLSGTIAICALILPGISGSFILLLMGMYTIIIPALKQWLQYRTMEHFYTIAVFGMGCLVGVTGFSRVMSWLFKNYKASTFVVLTGFLLGSLNKIWPWRNVSTYLNKQTNQLTDFTDLQSFKAIPSKDIRVLTEHNVWPHEYIMSNPQTVITFIAALIGFVLIFWLERNVKSDSID